MIKQMTSRLNLPTQVPMLITTMTTVSKREHPTLMGGFQHVSFHNYASRVMVTSVDGQRLERQQTEQGVHFCKFGGREKACLEHTKRQVTIFLSEGAMEGDWKKAQVTAITMSVHLTFLLQYREGISLD